MKNKKLTLSIMLFIFVLILGGFLVYGYYQKANYKLERPIVSMEIEGYGTVKMELYPDMAPNTVRNFIKLINDGYYNGRIFHRIEENLVQAGEKEGEENNVASYGIDGEFSKNGYEGNELKFERGTVGMALTKSEYTSYFGGQFPELIKEENNSAFAEFFIMTEDYDAFNGYYAPFAKVTQGIEIIDEISKLENQTITDEETGETSETSKPVNPPVITKMTVDTFGENYGDPKTHETFDINSYLMQKLYGISY